MAGLRSSKRTYRWAEGTRVAKAKANLFGMTLEGIKSSQGKFSASDVVNEARHKSSPIHDMFEWNNKVAGEKYRETQARAYIRALVVIVSNGKNREMPVAVSFGPGEDYTDSERVMTSTELRERLLEQALAEAKSWRDRYRHFSELAEIFKAIDGIAIGQMMDAAGQGCDG